VKALSRILGFTTGILAACGPRDESQHSDGPLGRIESALSTPARGDSIPIGIENVNDSPMKDAAYRALMRFVPDATITIDRFYFGFKLRGAACWDSGVAGYGSGDGGTLEASLVNIDAATGLPTTSISTETVNGCTRHGEASAEVKGSDPVLVWINTPATLLGGAMYGLVVRNAHANPSGNFFSFNMPLADTTLAGPHARNELDARAPGAILSLDPREHVAWSTDGGATWRYGSENGQYRSYMNDHDTAHPATRMPQYGWRRSDGVTVAQQPYYAYSDDCTGCSVTYANARYARTFTLVGGFIASGTNVGTLTLTNTSKKTSSSCTPPQGYGFRTCTLPSGISVGVGESYTVSSTGSVEIMRLDNPQRLMFPRVGTPAGELRSFQASAAPGTNAKDVPSLWAGPVSANFPGAADPGGAGGGVGTDGGGAGGAGVGGAAGSFLSGSGGASTGSDGGGFAGAQPSGTGGAGGLARGGAPPDGGGGGSSTAAGSAGGTPNADGCSCRMARADHLAPSWLAPLGLAVVRGRRRRRLARGAQRNVTRSSVSHLLG
jgi:MYXO-CTERM domain-containing protein